MKLLAILMSFFVLSAQAQVVPGAALKEAFDELTYALTVEWDQKDQKFHDTQVEKFASTLSQLQEKGLTQEELIHVVKTNSKDEKLIKDIEKAQELYSLNKLSHAEAQEMARDIAAKSYARGASWDSSIEWGGVAVTVVALSTIILAVVLVHKPHDYETK